MLLTLSGAMPRVRGTVCVNRAQICGVLGEPAGTGAALGYQERPARGTICGLVSDHSSAIIRAMTKHSLETRCRHRAILPKCDDRGHPDE